MGGELPIRIVYIYIYAKLYSKHFNRITNEDLIEFPMTITSNSQSFIPFELVESAKSVPISYCLGSHNITK